MKLFFRSVFISLILALFVIAPVQAATNPSLGMASTFVILASTYTNTVIGTTLNGDLGYTTPPVVAPTVNGTTHTADSVYNQAGIDQATALTALNSQPCTFTFAPGAIDLGSDITHGTVGVYAPGVYCITGAATIGGGSTITLTGTGTYIFRMTGAFTSTAGSVVTSASGASACDVWWTPGAATTLGANSTFFGSDIDASGITIGSTVNWIGRALAFGGTVSTATDTISAPTCLAAATATPTATATATATSSATATATTSGVPGLPGTGTGPQSPSSWPLVTTAVFLGSSALYLILQKRKTVSRRGA